MNVRFKLLNVINNLVDIPELVNYIVVRGIKEVNDLDFLLEATSKENSEDELPLKYR